MHYYCYTDVFDVVMCKESNFFLCKEKRNKYWIFPSFTDSVHMKNEVKYSEWFFIRGGIDEETYDVFVLSTLILSKKKGKEINYFTIIFSRMSIESLHQGWAKIAKILLKDDRKLKISD